MVRYIVLGATGHLGQQVVYQLVRAKHSVTAVCRDVDIASIRLPPLTNLAKGDVTNADALIPILRGADVVISCVGPRNVTNPKSLFSSAMVAVTKAVAAAGVPKFIVVTADSDVSQRDPAHQPPLLGAVGRLLRKSLYADMRAYEDWLADAAGIDFGRPAPGKVPRDASVARLAITVARAYPFASLLETKDFRAHVCSATAPTIPGGPTHRTGIKSLAAFLCTAVLDAQYANTAVLVDTPGGVAIGCFP